MGRYKRQGEEGIGKKQGRIIKQTKKIGVEKLSFYF